MKRWFRVKLNLHERKRAMMFKKGEIWWCNFGENIGVEVNGKNAKFVRPAIIFKKYNQHSFLAIPLTSQPHAGSWYVEFELRDKTSWANLAQIKSLSAKRLHNRMGTMTNGDFRKVQARFHSLYCRDSE